MSIIGASNSESSLIRPFSLGAAALRLLPKSSALARAARAYRNWYSGENNVWADTNGEFWAMEQLLPSCSVLFDVGANVGDWSKKAISVNPSLIVHCFEAAPDNFAKLRSSYHAASLVLNQCAVTDIRGSVDLKLYGEGSPFNSIVAPDQTDIGYSHETITVPAIRLDDYADEHGIERIDYVKIDVEGAEASVLGGMSRLFERQAVAAVQIEHGQFSIYSRTLIRDYFEIFGKHGFDMYKLVQKSLVLHEFYTAAIESFNHQNWLAVRRGSDLAKKLAQLG